MKKSKFGLIGTLLVLAMLMGSITSVKGTTYTCAGVVGAQAIWEVKTVHAGALTDIFGVSPTWEGVITGSFGPGSDQLGAKLKTVVTIVNKSVTLTPPIGSCEFCIIYSDVWIWTTSPFTANPDVNDSATLIWMHPENLTLYCQVASGFTRNVSFAMAAMFLGALPVPAGTYLSEIVWDNDYSVLGTTVTHNVAAGYIGAAGVYIDNCTESWSFSNSYGTFLGYKLVHENGTTAYETAIVVSEAAIPGFELTITLGASMGAIISIIYVITRKKR